MIRVALVRGKYLNNYEGQNYRFDKKKVELSAIASIYPLDTSVAFPIIKLFSPADFNNRFIKIVANRTLGDSQILFGLEKYADKFDIFHSADPHYYYSYQLAKLRKMNLIKKLLLTSWETIPFNNETIYRKKFIKRFTKDSADYFLCYTDKAKKCLIKEGVNGSKIKMIKLGVDLSRFDRNKQETRELTLLFVGRLVEEKGVLDLYQVFKKVKAKRLRIIGSGPLENYLKQLIKKDRLENSVIIERKIYKDIHKVYQNANIFIMPSKKTKTWEEQYGMVLIEAMASGLPIIAYDSGVTRENLGNAGVLVKENDINDLTKQLEHLMDNSTLRIKLGTMGRKRAEDIFDSRKTAKKILELYETINRDFS